MLRSILSIAAAACILASPLKAAELVMFESDACFWCDRWDREVGRYYGQTAEGRAAPLRRINLQDHRSKKFKNIKTILATPTFVLIEDGREIGRIVGYPGKRNFWLMLTRLLPKTD